MLLLQLIGEQINGILGTIVALLLPGTVATVLLAPFLVSKRVRSLFRSLPPTQSIVLSYGLVGIGASVPFIVGFGTIVLTIDPNGAGPVPLSNAIFTLTILLFVGYTIGTPVLGTMLVPRLGYDWDPMDYSVSTWLILAGGGAWYALIFSIPLIIVSLVFALPGGY